MTQDEPHWVRPVWQLTAHALFEQTWPAPQAAPQAPQLRPSVWVLTHAAGAPSVPPHVVWPVGHVAEQWPPLQDCPGAHVTLHPPQLTFSVSSFAQ